LWADAKGFHFFETSAQNGDGITEAFQCVFENVMLALENGGKRQPIKTQLGYSKEQAEAIQRLKTAKDNYDRLGLQPGATKYDTTIINEIILLKINNFYRLCV
jgi:DnaJ family protein C protein 27